MYFWKKKYMRSAHWGLWGKAPAEAGGIIENFCVKSKLTVSKVTFNCKLQNKIGGTACTSCSPNNFVGGAIA